MYEEKVEIFGVLEIPSWVKNFSLRTWKSGRMNWKKNIVDKKWIEDYGGQGEEIYEI